MRAERAEEWQLWLEMARESFKAARSAEMEGLLRPALSRYYYAAYQAATAILLYRKQKPPESREAWSHAETPQILREALALAIRSENIRKQITYKLRTLYHYRVDADYIASVRVERSTVDKARKLAGYLFKVAEEVLVRGKKP